MSNETAEPAADGAAADSSSALVDDADPYASEKANLRSITRWIMAGAGAIATVLVAGSQLSDIGSLDPGDRVTIYDIEISRLQLAIVGLGLAFFGLALGLALAAWVQTTSHVSLADVEKWDPERRGVLSAGAKSRTKRAIEDDLAERGIPPTAGSCVTTVVSRWRAASVAEFDLYERLLAPGKLNAIGLIPRTGDTADAWAANEAALVGGVLGTLSTYSRSKTPPPFPSAEGSKALKDMESSLQHYYETFGADTTRRFEFVNRVLQDASYLRMSKSFSMTLKYLIFGLVLVAVGIALFVWATHPADGASSRNPTVKVVPLSGQGVPDVLLGAGCDGSTLSVSIAQDSKTAIVSASAIGPDVVCAFTVS